TNSVNRSSPACATRSSAHKPRGRESKRSKSHSSSALRSSRNALHGSAARQGCLVAIPPALLKELLALEERERLEVALLLLDSIDEDRLSSDEERAKLHATIELA